MSDRKLTADHLRDAAGLLSAYTRRDDGGFWELIEVYRSDVIELIASLCLVACLHVKEIVSLRAVVLARSESFDDALRLVNEAAGALGTERRREAVVEILSEFSLRADDFVGGAQGKPDQ